MTIDIVLRRHARQPPLDMIRLHRNIALHLLFLAAAVCAGSSDHLPAGAAAGNRRLISTPVGDALDPTQAPQCADALCLVQALLNKRPQIYITANIDLQGVGILPSVVHGAVSISGLCDVSRCRIDAKGQSGIFAVGLGGVLTLKDLELTGGSCTDGPAVLVSGLGADSLSSSGKLHALNVKFFNNVATGTGGAISVQSGGSIAVTNSVFYNNKAAIGGAVYLGGSKKLPPTTPVGPAATCSGVVSCATFSNTEFARNQALKSGGAIFAADTSPDCSSVAAGPQFDVTACTFLNNTASSGNGGALLLSSVSSGTAATARNSVFLNNTSPAGDGANVYVEAMPAPATQTGAPGSRLNAYSCTFTSANGAQPGAAAAVSVGNGSSATFTKCDFSAYLAGKPTVCKGSCNVTCPVNRSSQQIDDQGSCFNVPPPGPMCPWRPDDCPPTDSAASPSPSPNPAPPSNQSSSAPAPATPPSPSPTKTTPPPPSNQSSSAPATPPSPSPTKATPSPGPASSSAPPSSPGSPSKKKKSPSDGRGTVQSGPSSQGSPPKKRQSGGSGNVQSGPSNPAASAPSPAAAAAGGERGNGSAQSGPSSSSPPGRPGKNPWPRRPSDGNGTVQSGPSSPAPAPPPSSSASSPPPPKKQKKGKNYGAGGDGTIENAPPAPPPPPSSSSSVPPSSPPTPSSSVPPVLNPPSSSSRPTPPSPSSAPPTVPSSSSPPSSNSSTPVITTQPPPPHKTRWNKTNPPQGGDGTVENAPPAPPPPPSGSVTGDPHFIGKHGERFDFHGKDGRDYCVISDNHIHVNMHVFHGKLRKSTFISKLGILYRGESILIDVAGRNTAAGRHNGWRLVVDGVEVSGKDELLTTKSGLSVAKRARSVRIYAAGEVDIVADIIRATFGKRGSLRDYINLRVAQLSVSSRVHGLLGQTYQESSIIYDKLLAAKHKKRSRAAQVFLDGGESDYVTTDVLTPDCKFSVFQHQQSAWPRMKRMLLEPMQRFLSMEHHDRHLVSSCNGFGDHTLCLSS